VRNWAAAGASPLGRRFAHHHRYCFADLPEKPTALDAAEFSFDLVSLSTSTKPHEIWWRATSARPVSAAPIKGRFALHIELGTPTPLQNVANIIKPLLDGVVCAMHAESQVDAEAVERLSRASMWDATEISNRLSAPPNAILGSRRLLQCYRDFVKWDPADDLCDDCTVLVSPASRLTCTVVAAPLATEHSVGAFSVVASARAIP
jgi:hypothetical protein